MIEQRWYAVKLQHDKGKLVVSTLATSARVAVRKVLAVEPTSPSAVVWVKQRPTCDYCDQPGTRYVKDSGEGTPLCRADAQGHYGSAKDVRPATGILGITRFILVEAAEWQGEPGS